MRLPLGGTAGASGIVSLPLSVWDSRGWRVTQVSTSMAAGSAAAVSGTATGALKVNGSLVSPFVAQGDAVGGDPSLDLQVGDVMTVEWTGCTPGNVCSALVFYEPLT